EAALLPVSGNPAPTVTVPLGSVFAYARDVHETKNRDEWKKLIAARGKRDLIVVRQADGLNAMPGTVLEGVAEGKAISFGQGDGGKKVYQLSRPTGGLVFNQPPRDVIPPTVCKLTDVFGNTLFATKLDLAGAGLTVTTVNGATVVYASTAALAKLDFSKGNI